MNRRIMVSDRLITLLTALNLWAVGGGGILIALAGRPVFGMLLLAGALVILALTVIGRLGKNREFTVGNLMVVSIGIPILVIGLILMGAVLPANLNNVWYLYLAILIVLSGLTIVIAAMEVRATT